jgi:uncharacterized protein (TIGR02996 family)
MTSDRDALLAAIRANPDEDTPRLMFADFLDESGEGEYAEFIRAQCEFARLTDDAGDSQGLYEFLVGRDYITLPAADWSRIDAGLHRRTVLAARVAALLEAHADDWTPHLPDDAGVRWNGFDRGFAHRLVLEDVAKAAEHGDRLRASAPAVTLVAGEFTDHTVEQLADAGLLGWISGLHLAGPAATGLRAFGHHREAAGVRTLAAHGDRDAVASALADAPHWTGLRALALSGHEVSASAAETLLLAPHLRKLRRLALSSDNSAAAGLRVLAAGGRDLAALSLIDCDLDDDAAELLAACPDLANVRTLDVGHNRLTGRGVTALLCSPHLKNVAFLSLEGNSCAGLDAKRLAAAEPGGLRMLHAHGCPFRTPDVRALARCPRVRTLWYLDLDAAGIGSPAVRALVTGLRDFCPPILWMTHNRIDDRGLEELANWPAAAALRVLHLRYNNTTDAAARALLDSPHLADLDDLGVSNTDAETTARLKSRFKHFGAGYP